MLCSRHVFYSCCVFIQMTNLLVNYSLYLSSLVDLLSNRLIQSCHLIKVLLHHSVITHKLLQVPLLCSPIHDISHRTAGLVLPVYSRFHWKKVYSNLKIVPNQNFYSKPCGLCRNRNTSKSFYPYFRRRKGSKSLNPNSLCYPLLLQIVSNCSF